MEKIVQRVRSTTNSEALVSVAIITYNQKEFLRDCIESVLNQIYQNYEIIVSDDGSTDGTHEMLVEYEKKYPGKFNLVLSTHNRGITKNHNAALSQCNGAFIAWIGGDDIMLPEKLLDQVEYMNKHDDCMICYHDLEVFDSASNKKLYLFSEKNKPRTGTVETIISNGCFNGASSTMTRNNREVLFDARLPVASDWLFWVELLVDGGRIGYINKTLGRYRRHDNNITSADRGENNAGIVDHFLSCSIISVKYPQHMKKVLKSYSRLYLALRHIPGNYFNAIFLSLRSFPSFRVLFVLCLYLLTFGSIKP